MTGAAGRACDDARDVPPFQPLDLAEVIRRGGTLYLLGREDPYASASPLLTAVAVVPRQR